MRPFRTFLLAVLALLVTRPAAALIEVEEITTPAGIDLWLAQDDTVPLVAFEFILVPGGSALDPDGKEGLTQIAAQMLREGSGERDAKTFQQTLEDNAIRLSFSIDRDAFGGSLETLSENKELAFELLTDALSTPHLDADDFERQKASLLNRLNAEVRQPNRVAWRLLEHLVFDGHPYQHQPTGTVAGVEAIRLDDIRPALDARFARDRLLVSMVGDISEEDAVRLVDQVFAAWPETVPDAAEVPAPPPAIQNGAGAVFLHERAGPQSIIAMAQRGPKRSDPDWHAARIMNYTLGGGSFASRLMQEVREKRGLTYGVFSFLAPYDEIGLIMAGTTSANETAAEAYRIMREEWQRMAEGGITDAELEGAKTYLVGALPLRLTSNPGIAKILLQMRRYDLGIDYLERYEQYLLDVTARDVARVAKRFLIPGRLTVVAVGTPEGLEATDMVDDLPF